MNVSAKDLATGKARAPDQPGRRLSRTEIEKIIEEAASNKAADSKRKEIRQLKNKLEGMIAANDRIFREFGNLLQPDEGPRRAHAHGRRRSSRATNASRSTTR